MNDITPIFTSHYSFTSVLILDEKSDGPISIFDIAKESGLSEVYLLDSKFDGFVEAYKNSEKTGVKLNFGIQFVCCADHTKKDEESLKTESKINIFARNTQGISDLIKIYNRAWTENFYYQGRTSWLQLNDLWTDNLLFALPFFSSFVAQNTLTIKTIVPKIPVDESEIYLFDEQNSGLPFEPIVRGALEKFNGKRVKTKSIYYKNYADFKKYQVYRCIQNRTSYQKPNIDHFASNRFCWEDYMGLVKK